MYEGCSTGVKSADHWNKTKRSACRFEKSNFKLNLFVPAFCFSCSIAELCRIITSWYMLTLLVYLICSFTVSALSHSSQLSHHLFSFPSWIVTGCFRLTTVGQFHCYCCYNRLFSKYLCAYFYDLTSQYFLNSLMPFFWGEKEVKIHLKQLKQSFKCSQMEVKVNHW